jgi:hypothetical protein
MKIVSLLCQTLYIIGCLTTNKQKCERKLLYMEALLLSLQTTNLYIIKMVLTDQKWKMKWTELDQNRMQCWVFMITVSDIPDSLTGKFQTS